MCGRCTWGFKTQGRLAQRCKPGTFRSERSAAISSLGDKHGHRAWCRPVISAVLKCTCCHSAVNAGHVLPNCPRQHCQHNNSTPAHTNPQPKPAPNVGFAAGSVVVRVEESVGTVALTVQLSAAAAAPVIVAYRAFGGNATGNGVDYRPASGNLTFAPGETQKVQCGHAGCMTPFLCMCRPCNLHAVMHVRSIGTTTSRESLIRKGFA